MASRNPECEICEKQMNEVDKTVTTDCQHTFHIQCAENRLDQLKLGDCFLCEKESALVDALKRLAPKRCGICQRQLEKKDEIVTTDCQHIFHRRCAQKRFDEKQLTDCRTCKRESTLGDALKRLGPYITVSS